jgi:hypothetical protein
MSARTITKSTDMRQALIDVVEYHASGGGLSQCGLYDLCAAIDNHEASARADERRKVLEEVIRNLRQQAAANDHAATLDTCTEIGRDLCGTRSRALTTEAIRIEEQLAALAKRGEGGT